MKTNVYVDGFNLYYGCLKGTPYRWLDLGKLCKNILKQHEIHRIRYFTARIQARADDPQAAQRQQAYIRALGTIPILSVHYGRFLVSRVRMPLADPPKGGSRTAEVLKTEEKGSDVNLATYLLVDAFESDYEAALIISNDSDLVEPIGLVRDKLAHPVGVVNPHSNVSHALRKSASFYRELRTGALAASLFPDELSDDKGTIRKPPSW
jgi:uncharacterized LabA/DUF88 family protein